MGNMKVSEFQGRQQLLSQSPDPEVGSRNRFYETPFRPKTFRNFFVIAFGQNFTPKNQGQQFI
jgi:hypothetical protein